jgi:hypothetical protein
MNEDVRGTLKQIRSTVRGGGYVFINPDTAKSYTDVKTAFGTACQLAGIENRHWHDLRHTFGTRLAERVAVRRRLLILWDILIRKPRGAIHTRLTELSELRWKQCAFATVLPQNKNGHLCR